MTKKILIITIALGILLPTAALSQSYIPKPKGLPGPEFNTESGTIKDEEGSKEKTLTDTGKESLRTYLTDVVAPHFTKGFTGFAALFSFFGLIVAGIMYLLAYGREEMITKAKTVALWSTIGLLISLLSYAIVSIITQIKIA